MGRGWRRGKECEGCALQGEQRRQRASGRPDRVRSALTSWVNVIEAMIWSVHAAFLTMASGRLFLGSLTLSAAKPDIARRIHQALKYRRNLHGCRAAVQCKTRCCAQTLVMMFWPDDVDERWNDHELSVTHRVYRGWPDRGWCSRGALHHSLRTLAARSQAFRSVAFLANSWAIGCKKTPGASSRSARPPTREGDAGHPLQTF